MSISSNPHAKGVENIGIFLQAIHQCTFINMNHHSYQTEEQKAYTLESYLLKEFEKKFNHVYGLVYKPDNSSNAPIEKIRLKVSPIMMSYIQSLPIHSSQSISGDTIILHLIINPELETR